MFSLKEVLSQARDKKYALGHFNFSDSTQFNAIVDAAKDLSLPVVLGVSEGEKNFIGMENAVVLVRAARQRGRLVFLNLDHGHRVEDCYAAIDAGFDSVMFDGSKLPLAENIQKTRFVVEYARTKRRGMVLVEGELGYIGSSSKMLDDIPDGVTGMMTTPNQAREFISKTGVDLLAPSVGNLHGILAKTQHNPRLDIERVTAIAAVVSTWGTHMVLHGGSGIVDDDFRAAISAGFSLVHINTEIRRAYKEGIEEGVNNHTEIAPYRYFAPGYEAVYKTVSARLKLFAGIK